MISLRDETTTLGAPRVRDARVDDACALGALLAELGSEGEGDRVADRAMHLVPDAGDLSRSVLVAELAGEVVGYLQVTWVFPLHLAAPEGYVTELFVRAGARRRGVGTALLDDLQARARDRDVARVRLIDAPERAHVRDGFYPSRGYDQRQHLAVFERRFHLAD